MPLPEKLESVPPENETSPTTKSDDDSLKVNVMVAVSPTVSELSLVTIPMVGGVVSTTILILTAVIELPVSLRHKTASLVYDVQSAYVNNIDPSKPGRKCELETPPLIFSENKNDPDKLYNSK